jgi:NAD-dependent DNA ligase
MSALTTPQLVKTLKDAADAYYNSGKQILSDAEYDLLRDELEERDPENSFLTQVGAKPQGKVSKLPFFMASLNKIKPATGQVDAFVKKTKAKEVLLSDKLDGISALWTGTQLFLRGDGESGVDSSGIIPFVQGLVKTKDPIVVRGELVLLRKDVPSGTIARSWVNGQLHQKTLQKDQLKKIRFVAYEVIQPSKLIPFAQFEFMKLLGFEVPWYSIIPVENLEAKLKETLKVRRISSEYDTDGIVVASSLELSEVPKELKNPTAKVAFKMVLGEQCAETKVEEVIWTASAQGYLIPRIRVQPIVVGSARIEFVTGNNARFIVSNGIGPGARVSIRRSGDVIPAIDRVIFPSETNDLLPTDCSWKWNGDPVSAIHIINNEENNEDMMKARLVHFAKAFDIPGLGPGIAEKLVTAKISTIGKLLLATSAELIIVIGKTNGPKLFKVIDDIKKGIKGSSKVTELDWMIASSCMGRGVGHTKLESLFSIEKDPRRWRSLPAFPVGWSKDALEEFLKTYKTYEDWRSKETPMIPYPILSINTVSAAAAPKDSKGSICLSGFRSKPFQTEYEAKGWTFVDTVSKNLTYLLLPDDPVAESSKVKKAREISTIKILTLGDFKKMNI